MNKNSLTKMLQIPGNGALVNEKAVVHFPDFLMHGSARISSHITGIVGQQECAET
jgi:hypothetical protein